MGFSPDALGTEEINAQGSNLLANVRLGICFVLVCYSGGGGGAVRKLHATETSISLDKMGHQARTQSLTLILITF